MMWYVRHYRHNRSQPLTRSPTRLRFVAPDQVSLTAAQRSTAWYFFAVAALFLVQTLLGGATAHYHADDGSFFGLDLAQVLPYNLSRTWHLQLALFVVSAAFLAGGTPGP
jgi:nitric oxide reductase subunit B